MFVTIKDKDALNDITPENLREYLEATDFKKVDEYTYEFYSDTLHRHIVVKVPSDNDKFYHMSETMMNLEQALNKSQLQIYADITGKVVIFTPEKMMEAVMEEIKKHETSQ